MKIIMILVALTLPALCLGQSSQTYYLKTGAECYVKEYKAGKLILVSEKQFQGISLQAKQLTRSPQLMAFKVDEKIYMAQTICFEKKSSEALDDIEDNAFKNFQEQAKESSRATLVSSDFDKNKYFIEINGGSTNVSGTGAVFQNYEILNGTYSIDGVSGDITFGVAESGKYKAKSSISISGGMRASDSIFYSLKLRRFEGSKKEPVPVTVDIGGSIEQGIQNFEFKDTFTDVMIGAKYLFFKNSNFKPYVAALVGVSSIKSNLSDEDKMIFDNVELSSSGIVASAEAGFEYFFTSKVAVGPSAGYQYLGKREFKVKGKDGQLSSDTFKTKMDYSNTYLSLGVKVYFN